MPRLETSEIVAVSIIAGITIFFAWLIKKILYAAPADIFEAVMEFRYDFINSYLEEGRDINVKNKFGMTLLMVACDKGSKRGGYKYAISNDGPYASTLKLIEYLIIKGIDVNLRDNDGNNAAFYAIGTHDRLRILAEAGIDFNNRNNKGETVMIWSAKRNFFWTVETLLKLRADPEIKDNHGKTALDHATEKNNKRVVEIIKKYDKNAY